MLELSCARFKWSCKSTTSNFVKKQTLAQMISCEFLEISQNTFFIKPQRLLLLNHSSCLLPHQDFSLFPKRCHKYFAAECFLGLTCRQEWNNSWEKEWAQYFDPWHLITEVKLELNQSKTLTLDSQFLKRIGWNFNLKPRQTSSSE